MHMEFTPEQTALGASALMVGGGVLAAEFLPPILGRAVQFSRGLRFARSGDEFIQIGSLNLSDDARMRHTHIIGATGTGKTVLTEQLLYRDIARGYGAIIIDPKGERDFYLRVQKFCQSVGREADLYLLSATYPEESVRWNPCRLGNVSELQSKFFCASKYEHSFYAKAAELALLEAFRKINEGGKAGVILSDLADALDELSQGGKDENLKGLYFDIQNLVSGEWSEILGLGEKPGNQQEISLLDLTRRGEILFVDLPTEGKAVQSARLGALLLQELTLISGIRKRCPAFQSKSPFSVFVDEFDAFATEAFVTFLNKGRSSRFMIHMAHQTLSDLTKVSPTFKGQIMGNPNVRFIFRTDVAEDAEVLAEQFGTRLAVKRTQQTRDGVDTGMGNKRETKEFRIHPDTIKELKIGECIAGIKTAGTLEVLRVPVFKESRNPPSKFVEHRTALSRISRPSAKELKPFNAVSTYQGTFSTGGPECSG